MPRVILLVLGLVIVFASVVIAAQPGVPPEARRPSPQLVERGRYLVKIAGCNDCHTAGYMESGGAVPEAQWLTGNRLGWRGPWGTTYPINLRLYMNGMAEERWVAVARALRSRPPMPWFVLRDMADDDLRAVYHFVRSLGPAGEPAPAYLPPEHAPKHPYVQFP